MMKPYCYILIAMIGLELHAAEKLRISRVHTPDGVLEGVISSDGKVRTFKGVPYAAPPVGALRWKAPQPPVAWKGVRKAVDYGPRCMQGSIYDDMIFHDAGPSEDCLYLNLWMPTVPNQAKLPVMFWIHGGGFVAGASSEPRQDGGNLSKKGVLVVSLNYRMGVFGFFSHPELAKESGHDASGNYGLMDQVAALQWIRKNIALFGGDPNNVTIFGESAGSFSVSALMASPLAQGLVHRAIGESGAFFGATLSTKPHAQTEVEDAKFAESAFGTSSLAALRAMPAQKLLDASGKPDPERFGPNIDGYFLPESVDAIYAAGRQSHIPLLAGWNADEGSYRDFFGKDAPTAENYAAKIRAQFGDRADAFLKLYPGTSDEEAKRSASDFSGDQFIAFPTWKWMERHLQTGAGDLYRYEFDQAPPVAATPARGAPPADAGAYHSAEIEFVFGVLSSKALPWRPEDQRLSDLMGTYWTNFAKTGNPAGAGLPQWPLYTKQNGYPVLHLKANTSAEPDGNRARYEFMDTAVK